ncbi:MAG: glycosyltransferase [Alphaproteobacteria bacterium]
MKKPEVAVLIPCYNEAITIANVVKDFQKHLPHAKIYVFDNNSTDETMSLAQKAGAIVFRESYQGKGNVVRRMFREVQADIYLMVDGDETYDAAIAPQMIQDVENHAYDMIVGIRAADDKEAYPSGHALGNKLFNWALKIIFRSHFTDIFSGYRAFSKRFVKSFPALSSGFDIETELSIHALEMKCPVKEVSTIYRKRPEGSYSKLNTWTDGFKILWRMVILYKEMRPFMFFAQIGLAIFAMALFLGYPIVKNYIATGLVPRFPTAILSASLVIISFLSFTCGLILESLHQARREFKRLFYLNA